MEDSLKPEETSENLVAKPEEKKPKVSISSGETKSAKEEKNLITWLKIAVVLLLLTTIGGFVFGICEMLKPVPTCDGDENNETAISEDSDRDDGKEGVVEHPDGGGNKSTEADCPKCEKSTRVLVIPPDEKVIEDTNVIADLSKKVSWLNDIYGEGEEDMFVSVEDGYGDSLSTLYGLKTFSDTQKSIIVARLSFPSEEKTLSDDEKKTLYEEMQQYDGEIKSWLGEGLGKGSVTSIKFVPYSSINENYHELFGYEEDILKSYLYRECVRNYYYSYSLDGYIDLVDGCGRTGIPTIYLRKDYFTEKNDEAFVYVRIATRPGYERESLCNGYAVGDNISCWQSVAEVTSSDLDDVAVYKFSFKKNSAGTYSFVGVEKL